MSEDWDAQYEEAIDERTQWRDLTQIKAWEDLHRLGRNRCTVGKQEFGLLANPDDVARYNFELGIRAGIQWMLNLPVALAEDAQERVDHALAMLREESKDVEFKA